MARALAALSLSRICSSAGCCALALGPRHEVEFTSDPPGAVVEMHGQRGRTPCVLDVPRDSKAKMVRFSIHGREIGEVEVVPEQVEIRDRPDLLPLAIGDGLLVLPGIIDLCMYSRFYQWPGKINAVLPETGRGAPRIRCVRFADMDGETSR